LVTDHLLLQDADPQAWAVHPSWEPLVQVFWNSREGLDLLAFLSGRLAVGARIFPPQPLRALLLTPLPAVRVVVLGQDPYHGPGQAEGLSFSVAPSVPLPPSLRNVFKELQADTGLQPPMSGSLVPWAQRGVLLLNACLTVEEGRPASHAGQGWQVLTDAVISAVAQQPQPVVFLLWGAHAQAKRSLIETHLNGERLVLQANHPSPLSALRGATPFIGCRHFSTAQAWLNRRGVDCFWNLEE
jgi:uracil-DNA glycosylase